MPPRNRPRESLRARGAWMHAAAVCGDLAAVLGEWGARRDVSMT